MSGNDPETYWSEVVFNVFGSIVAFVMVYTLPLWLERWDGQRLANPHRKFAFPAKHGKKEKSPCVMIDGVDKQAKQCEHTAAPVFSADPDAVAGAVNHERPIFSPSTANTANTMFSPPISPRTLHHRRPYPPTYDGCSDICECRPVIHVVPHCPIHGDYFDVKEAGDGSDEKEERYVYY